MQLTSNGARPKMNDFPNIPEASDPDTYVRGRLAPAPLARQVRAGWKAGIIYVVLLIVGATFLYPEDIVTTTIKFLVAAEVALSCALTFGIYRWYAFAAWSLLGLLILSAVAAAIHPPHMPTPGSAAFRIGFLVAFGVLFGRAAIAIRAFSRGA